VTPTVRVGQVVNSSTVIAHMYSGGGPFPARVGLNFEELLQALGVPASPFDRYVPPYGLLPTGYPTWPSRLHGARHSSS
jgi:hypothetical protein